MRFWSRKPARTTEDQGLPVPLNLLTDNLSRETSPRFCEVAVRHAVVCLRFDLNFL
jgi:hypothetical protein